MWKEGAWGWNEVAGPRGHGRNSGLAQRGSIDMHTRRNVTFSVKGEKEVLMGFAVDLKCKLEH